MKRMLAMVVLALFLGAVSTTTLVGCKGGEAKKETKAEEKKKEEEKKAEEKK